MVQADGRRDLQLDANRGDDGDPFPGSAANTAFGPGTTPNSRSYAGSSTRVAITHISPPGPVMSARLAVR